MTLSYQGAPILLQMPPALPCLLGPVTDVAPIGRARGEDGQLRRVPLSWAFCFRRTAIVGTRIGRPNFNCVRKSLALSVALVFELPLKSAQIPNESGFLRQVYDIVGVGVSRCMPASA